MFDCPYCDPNFPLYRVPSVSSYIRIFHASPNTSAVDIFLDDALIVRRITYKNFSPYLKIMPGKHNVKVYKSGIRQIPIINTNIDILSKNIITVSAIGMLPEISLLPIIEPSQSRIQGKAYIRFSHLSPNAPNLDVTFENDKKIFTNVGYKTTTNYIAVNPGIHTFNVNLTSNGERVIYVPNTKLLPNKIYTLYAVGLKDMTPPLQVLIPLDGITYLKV
jgi:hypothetical protein